MKKLLLTCCFIVASITVFAQYYGNNNYPVITFGVSGGSNFAFLNPTSPYRSSVLLDAEQPFSLGVNADIRFNDYFSIRPGLSYAGKGGTLNAIYGDSQLNTVSVYDDYRLHYLEIPVDFIGHLPIGNSGANIFLGGGPYFSLGLSGRNLQSFYNQDPTLYKVTYGRNGDFKSMDVGATTVMGFQAGRGWAISANLEFGLNNIMQNNTTGFDASQLKTFTFYLSIGQSF